MGNGGLRASAAVLAMTTVILSGLATPPARAIGLMSPLAPLVVPTARALITGTIDDRKLGRLEGNTRPEIAGAADFGPVNDRLQLDHLYLQLRRSPERDQAADELERRLHDRAAPEYHHWLSIAQVAARFGPAESDVVRVAGWLRLHGFRVNAVYRANGVIDFSGPASAVRSAFHTEIHQFAVNGQAHIANVHDPYIPAALIGAVVGVTSLNDFRPSALYAHRVPPAYSVPGNPMIYPVVPGDLAKIYHFDSLFLNGFSGQGMTITLLERSDLFDVADWTRFRTEFGLTQSYPSGNLQLVHPMGCTDPGVVSIDDDEAMLDAQWSSAAAPSATISVASCKDTKINFGPLIALQNLLYSATGPPAVVSLSYASTEAAQGQTMNYSISGLYLLASMMGTSIFVSSGDAGAALGDTNKRFASHGVQVNGLASTPFNVAVGGTDFADSYDNESSRYWSQTNGADYSSALSYVPEIPWNDSCGSSLIAQVLDVATTYGKDGLCNSPIGREDLLTTASGGGGPSSFLLKYRGPCCVGYPKPPFQYGIAGNPADGVRDLPDVSMFAANGIWRHYYVYCNTDPNDSESTQSCSGAPSTWPGAGGTSFAAPVMAGVQALVDQYTRQYQGNPDWTYYRLASTPGLTCPSSGLQAPTASCVFHDVQTGDIDVPCRGVINCYEPSGRIGVLSLSDTRYEPAYAAQAGWDFATGLGSVDVANLVYSWPR